MAWITRVEGARGVRYKVGWRDPSRHIRYKTFQRKGEAEVYRQEVESSKRYGTYVDPRRGRIPFADLIEHYLTTSDLKPTTMANYRSLVANHLKPHLGSVPVNALTTAHLREWVAGMQARGVGARTVQMSLGLVRAILNLAKVEDYIAKNPADAVRVKRAASREPRFLTPTEVTALAEGVARPYRALIYFLAYAGVRIGEASALKIDALDLLRGRVTIRATASEVNGRRIEGTTKSDRVRTVVLPQMLVEILGTHLAAYPPDPATGLVFTTAKGAPIRQGNFRKRVFHPACAAVGLDPLPRVHDLRHTTVALALAAGANPKEIQDMLGHSTITVTMDRYGHLFESLHEETARRLDGILREADGLPASRGVVKLTG